MLFISIEFIIFLPIVFWLYWFVFKEIKRQNILILLASYVFYGWWSKKFLILILFSTLVVLFPRYTAKEAFALFHKLPEKYVINVADPGKYPEFYLSKYSFDIGHLNNEGAKLLPKKLAEELNKKLNE